MLIRVGFKLFLRTQNLIPLLLCSFGIMLFAPRAFAAHPLITDDAGTQGKNRFQLELNWEYDHDRDDDVTMKTTQAAISLSYGITDPVDIVLGIPYQHIRTEDSETTDTEGGFSDISLELKWRFYERDGLSLAVKPGVSLPTGDEEEGLGSGSTQPYIFFITSKQIEPWAFHANLGYIGNENDNDERKNCWHASLAVTFEIIEDLQIVGNIGVERDPDRDGDIHPAFGIVGLIYSVSENFDVDLGVKGGLTKSETDYSVLAGIAWRF